MSGIKSDVTDNFYMCLTRLVRSFFRDPFCDFVLKTKREELEKGHLFILNISESKYWRFFIWTNADLLCFNKVSKVNFSS